MKQHFQKIGEGFQGLGKDILTYSKNGAKKLYTKSKVYLKKVDKFLGKTGWFLIIAIIVIWTLLAYYSKIIYATNHISNDGFESIYNSKIELENFYKQINQTKNNKNKIINNLLFQTKKPSYQNYQHFFSSTNDLEYSVYLQNDSLEGFLISKDKKQLNSYLKQIQKLGIEAHLDGEKILFFGNSKSYQDLINIFSK